ncbi:MAG: molybdopterin-dependent oxidoreductase, partial [Halobacteria archaeon]|nr:molybdopterin-dependent oxidoreductase [Halobacteria archaeon]
MSSDRDNDSLEDTLDKYREKIDFDETSQISHPQDCYPGNCSLVGYKKDGELRYQEQTGKYPVVDSETPDWNPRGCSRQCSYTDATYGEERIEQPMKQMGERGSGEWEPISWEEAYEEIAEAMVDAMEDDPQSIVNESPPGEGGSTYGITPFTRLTSQAGGINLDLESAVIQDFSAGMYQTFGKYQFCSTQDEWFKADLNLVWNMNPAYSRNPSYHFLTEARYNGSETVVIAPDYSPSCDAALALGMCRVILENDLADWEFVKEQTDLPLLVREDNDRFVRESDFEDDGSDEKFYVWDTNANDNAGDEDDEGLVQAPRETLELGDIDPALEGRFEVEIDGETVEVRPVFERLRDKIENEYDLETVQEITGVHPSVVEEIARKVANNRTNIMNSWNTAKVFHGDLIERGMALLLA